jgi:hypothetical protein
MKTYESAHNKKYFLCLNLTTKNAGIALAKKKNSKIALNVLTSKKEGFWAHQMCESMTILVKPTFKHNLQIN